MSLLMNIALILILVFPTIEDIKTREIRNVYFLIIFIIKIFLLFLTKSRESLISSFLSLFVAALMLIFCFFVSKKGMGKGDVFLLLSIAFYCETELFLRGLLFTSIGSILFSLILLARKQIGKNDEVPFVPFILFGTIVTTLFEVIK